MDYTAISLFLSIYYTYVDLVGSTSTFELNVLGSNPDCEPMDFPNRK